MCMNTCKIYTQSPQHLDQYEVFIEDDYYNPRYFDIRIIPDMLTYGKHMFMIGALSVTDQYSLKMGSSVKVEVEDANDKIIYHEFILSDNISGAGTGYLWLLEDPVGYFSIDDLVNNIATITILGELDGVPEVWEGIYNVRMQVDIPIRKDFPNNSPLYFTKTPEMIVSESLLTDVDSGHFQRSFASFKIDKTHTIGGLWKFGEITYTPVSASTSDTKIMDTFEVTSSIEMLRDNISNVGITGLLDNTGNQTQTNTNEWIGNFSSSTQVNNWKYSGGQIDGNSIMLPHALLQTGSNSNAYKLFRYAHDYEEYEIKYKISGSGNIIIKTSPINTDVTSSLTTYGEDTANIKTAYNKSFVKFDPNHNLTWTSSVIDTSTEMISGSGTAIIKGKFCIPSSSYATIWLNCTDDTISASWAEVSIKPSDIKGTNPPFYYHTVEMPKERRADKYDFKLKFLNPDMQVAKLLTVNNENVESTSATTYFVGSPFILERDDNIISAGALKTPGYLGYHSASLGTGSGFMIYSGSVLDGGFGGTEYESDEVGLELAGGLESEGSGSLKFSTKTGKLEVTGSFATTGDGVFGGTIIATDGTIGGWNIDAHKLSTTGFEVADSTNQYILSSSNFQVDTAGFVTASGLTVNVTPDKPYQIISGSKSGSMKIDHKGDFSVETLSGSFKVSGSRFEIKNRISDKKTFFNVRDDGDVDFETNTGVKNLVFKNVSEGSYAGVKGMLVGGGLSTKHFPVAQFHSKGNIGSDLFGNTDITTDAILSGKNITMILEADYGNGLMLATEADTNNQRFQNLTFASVLVVGDARYLYEDFQFATKHTKMGSDYNVLTFKASGSSIWEMSYRSDIQTDANDWTFNIYKNTSLSKNLTVNGNLFGTTAGGLTVSSSNTTLIPFSIEHPQSGSLFSTYADDGGGSLVVSGTLNTHKIQSTGSAAVVNINDSVNVTGNITASGNIVSSGNIIANQYIVSSSVTYITSSFMSGSTQFGDSVDDIHTFTGSYIQMSSSAGTGLTIKGDISGSDQFLLVGSASIGDSTAVAPNHGLYISGSVSSSNHISASTFHTPLGLTSSIHALTASHALNSGGGGGISFDGSTADGVLTYKDADEATVESNLVFNGSKLDVQGVVYASGQITSSGAITGSGLQAINVSASGNITGSNIYAGTGVYSTNLYGTLQTAAQTNITSVGTIGTGVWNGTEVGLGYGGTELVGETDGKIVIADGAGAPVHLDVGSSTGITILGTIGTGTWQGTAVASAYLDSDTAHLTTTQTFSGLKTFSSDITASGNISGSATGSFADLVVAGSGTGELIVEGTVSASSFITASAFHTPLGLTSSIHAITASYAHNAGGGGGAIDISGTPVNNQIAIWTDADTLEGDSELTYDGTTLNVAGIVYASGQITSSGAITGSGLQVTNISASGTSHIFGGSDSTVLTVKHPQTGSLMEVKATADSGSIALSGSLYLQNNTAIPAVSSSKLYNNDGHLYFDTQLVGGYHLSGSSNADGYLKILPGDCMVNDDYNTYGGPVVEDNGYAMSVGSTNQELYCFKDIPYGWKATAFRMFGNSTDVTTFYSYEITDTTATADGNTGTLNGAEVTLATDISSTATNYVGVKVATNSIGDFIYGGYIKIERA